MQGILRGTIGAAVSCMLAACVTNAPPAATATGGQNRATPTVSTAPTKPSELKDEKLVGYQVVNIDGNKRYCRTEYYTGSRVQKTTTCITEDQLRQQQDSGRDYLHSQQGNGQFGSQCTTGQGGGAVGCQ